MTQGHFHIGGKVGDQRRNTDTAKELVGQIFDQGPCQIGAHVDGTALPHFSDGNGSPPAGETAAPAAKHLNVRINVKQLVEMGSFVLSIAEHELISSCSGAGWTWRCGFVQPEFRAMQTEETVGTGLGDATEFLDANTAEFGKAAARSRYRRDVVMLVARAGHGADHQRAAARPCRHKLRGPPGARLQAQSLQYRVRATSPLATAESIVADTTPEGMIETIAATIPRLLSQANRQESEIRGIGVSIPGEIDPASGICLQSPRFGWKNLPFAEMLAERVHVPVWIDDDVNAFAVAQKLFGVGRDHLNFAALAIGAGIGCSLVIKGEIHHGSHCAAGKIGHITSVPNGRLYECGRRGCLMAHAAEPYMLDEWRNRTGYATSRAEFAASVEHGDDMALSILSDCGSRIGRHLADMVNLFDPEIIVGGGEAVEFGDALLAPIRRTMEEFAFFTKSELVPDWVPSSWARGAVALATQNIFDFERSPSR